MSRGLGDVYKRQQLDQAEQQVVKLMKGPDGAPVEQPFESTEEV